MKKGKLDSSLVACVFDTLRDLRLYGLLDGEVELLAWKKTLFQNVAAPATTMLLREYLAFQQEAELQAQRQTMEAEIVPPAVIDAAVTAFLSADASLPDAEPEAIVEATMAEADVDVMALPDIPVEAPWPAPRACRTIWRR